MDREKKKRKTSKTSSKTMLVDCILMKTKVKNMKVDKIKIKYIKLVF